MIQPYCESFDTPSPFIAAGAARSAKLILFLSSPATPFAHARRQSFFLTHPLYS